MRVFVLIYNERPNAHRMGLSGDVLIMDNLLKCVLCCHQQHSAYAAGSRTCPNQSQLPGPVTTVRPDVTCLAFLIPALALHNTAHYSVVVWGYSLCIAGCLQHTDQASHGVCWQVVDCNVLHMHAHTAHRDTHTHTHTMRLHMHAHTADQDLHTHAYCHGIRLTSDW